LLAYGPLAPKNEAYFQEIQIVIAECFVSVLHLIFEMAERIEQA